MSISKQPHNVSVRFSEEDYKQLMFLQDKFSRMSYGKVSLADVLRIATKELYNIESADMNRPITREKSYTPKETVQISDSENKDQEIVVKIDDPENNKEIQITEKIKEESLSTKIERENELLQEAQQEQQEQKEA
ncbi:hypothetical protein CN399_08925 [Bacillus cereus]|uniref:hypothetical protein n=1 Tax=Bacillus cereus TaxID=1396 RepID=UPI000BF6FBCF|nr:hypothetical protein [Bacillus cereus]PFB17070.1 hypothetical protein CN399_08925 [Bacillus cereus]